MFNFLPVIRYIILLMLTDLYLSLTVLPFVKAWIHLFSFPHGELRPRNHSVIIFPENSHDNVSIHILKKEDMDTHDCLSRKGTFGITIVLHDIYIIIVNLLLKWGKLMIMFLCFCKTWKRLKQFSFYFFQKMLL